jgi:hypothetical protein
MEAPLGASRGGGGRSAAGGAAGWPTASGDLPKRAKGKSSDNPTAQENPLLFFKSHEDK